MVKEHLEMILENINSKFDLILDGHEELRGEIRELGRKTDERFDLVDFKIDTLNKKIDGVDARLSQKIDDVDAKLSQKIDDVTAELQAHRADTEVHRGLPGAGGVIVAMVAESADVAWSPS
jgi:hypothetical protein